MACYFLGFHWDQSRKKFFFVNWVQNIEWQPIRWHRDEPMMNICWWSSIIFGAVNGWMCFCLHFINLQISCPYFASSVLCLVLLGSGWCQQLDFAQAECWYSACVRWCTTPHTTAPQSSSLPPTCWQTWSLPNPVHCRTTYYWKFYSNQRRSNIAASWRWWATGKLLWVFYSSS